MAKDINGFEKSPFTIVEGYSDGVNDYSLLNTFDDPLTGYYRYRVVNGTAVRGKDFNLVDYQGNIQNYDWGFVYGTGNPAGPAFNQRIVPNIKIINNDLNQPDRKFYLILTPAVSSGGPSNGMGVTCTITDTLKTAQTNSIKKWTGVENLTLIGTANINGTGNNGNNTITGNSGNNTLDGGGGADNMIGGTGNDTYFVDNTGDIITETSTLTTEVDSVKTTINYTVSANVENLTLNGTGNINGTGNKSNNTLTGNSGKNILDGKEGNDTLIGGGGADTLKGGVGNDTYEIDPTNAGGSKIEDTSGTDTIKITGITKRFLAQGQIGFGRKETSLIIDLNKNGQIDSEQADGKINLTKDLEISNFFSSNTGWEAGSGFIEKIGNFTGNEILNLFNLEGKESVTGGSTQGKPLSDVDKNYRNIQFKIISSGNQNLGDIKNKWDGNTQVWVVIHGWNRQSQSVSSAKDDNMNQLADTVAKAKTNDIVLTLDWQEAATNVGQLTNWDAASWISSVANFASEKLKAWGINGQHLNFIGHSLGSLLSSEIASKFTGGINTITALEPPSESNILLRGGYDLDASRSGIQRPVRFDKVSRFSRSFLGSRSVAGNDQFASWAHESILMDFGSHATLNGDEHSWVVQAFTELIRQNSSVGLADNLFTLRSDDKVSSDFKPDQFEVFAPALKKSEGVINVAQPVGTNPPKPLSFIAKSNSPDLDDLIYGTNGNDILTDNSRDSGTGNDKLIGGNGDDKLTASLGNDILDGGAGTDTMIGGVGNDTYIVDNSSDVITELANQGTDSVQSSVTYSLGANIENLTLTGTANINGTGNSLNNIIIGNSANNTLTGGDGNDTLSGGDNKDSLFGNAGTDTLNGDAGDDYLSGGDGDDTLNSGDGLDVLEGGLGNDSLSGGNGNDTLKGESGNDYLSGGAGADTMIGGTGNDTYIVDNTGDIVTETSTIATEIDTVSSSLTYTLVLNVERLTLSGTAAINGTGNSLSNFITGNSGSNILYGAGGNDTLTGGAGIDRFLFNSKTEGIDTITDFTSNVTTGDKIAISALGFGGGLVAGTPINANQLLTVTSGSAATSTTQRFIYNSTTGGLFFDADGSGTTAVAVQFATLGSTTHPTTLAVTDFAIV